MLIAIACFAGVQGLLLSAYWFFVVRPEKAAQRTLSRRLKPTRAVERLSETALVNEPKPNRPLPGVARALRRVEQLIEGSGYSVSLGQIVLSSAFAALLGAFAILQLTSQPLLGI